MLHYDILQNLQTSLLLEGANIVLQNIEGNCNKHLWILATISDLKFHFDLQFAIFM